MLACESQLLTLFLHCVFVFSLCGFSILKTNGFTGFSTLTQSNFAICSLRFLSNYPKNGHHCNTTPVLSSLKSTVGPLVSCRRANYKSLFASMSVNDKVKIRWLTEDGWKGIEHRLHDDVCCPLFRSSLQFFMPIYGRKMSNHKLHN